MPHICVSVSLVHAASCGMLCHWQMCLRGIDQGLTWGGIPVIPSCAEVALGFQQPVALFQCHCQVDQVQSICREQQMWAGSCSNARPGSMQMRGAGAPAGMGFVSKVSGPASQVPGSTQAVLHLTPACWLMACRAPTE